MQVLTTVAEMARWRAALGSSAGPVGLVPTMGALHAGHGRLMETARAECGTLLATIFVNPLQFGPREDFAAYPRTPGEDLDFCRSRGVDAVFAPGAQEIYPRPQLAFVDVEKVSAHLCGPFRPGHFRGVATVVLKLLHITRPDLAYFGEKDAQQLALIRRMVQDLDLAVRIIAVPTVREADGLAVSSRNRHLTPEQRQTAVVLYRALEAAAQSVAGGARDVSAVRQAALELLLRHPDVQVDYVEVVDPEEMQPVASVAGPVRIAGAIRIGATRLIDNLLASPENRGQTT